MKDSGSCSQMMPSCKSSTEVSILYCSGVNDRMLLVGGRGLNPVMFVYHSIEEGRQGKRGGGGGCNNENIKFQKLPEVACK